MAGSANRSHGSRPTGSPGNGTADHHAADPGEPIEDVVADDVTVLSALANETRYETLRALVGAEDGLYVRELEERVGASQSAISHGLAALYDVDLVRRSKDGRRRLYRPTEKATTIVYALDASR